MRPFDKLRVTQIVFALALSACTTGQTNTTPPINTGGGGPTSTGVLQLTVGTAYYSNDHNVGLNVLETFRDGTGYTAVPISTVMLHGPSGFVAPSGSKDPGSGAKGTIPLGSAADTFDVGPAGQSTNLAGADGWGIGPPSCSCTGVNFYPMQPQFADVATPFTFIGGAEPFYGGPPAYPPTVLNPSALSGGLVDIPSEWSMGFYLIGLTKAPPSGRYSIGVSYQQNGATLTRSASAMLDARHPLDAFQTPVVNSDGKGGLTVHVVLGRRVKQAIVYVIDSNVPPVPGATCLTGLGFATVEFTASGTKSIPDDLGNYGAGGAKTFCKGDLLDAQAFGFDYDDFNLGPPHNTQQRPSLPAQADITISTPAIATE